MSDQNYNLSTYIVTVNYKSGQVLLNFLNSLNELHLAGSEIQIIVVDSSGELNPNLVSSVSTHKVEVIRLPINRGFAYAANIGLRTSLQYSKLKKIQSYAWLLNPDTLIHPDALVNLLPHCNQHTIIGSAVTNEGYASDSTIWGAGGTVDDDLNVDMNSHGQPLSTLPDAPFECDYIPGCSMFIPTTLLEKYSYLPEEFFLYFEETDWCLSLRKKGVNLKIIPKSLVQHISESGKMNNPYRVYFYNRNQIYFKFKNLSTKKKKFGVLLKTILTIPKLIFLVAKEKDKNLKTTFLAHLLANLDASRMLIMSASNLKLWNDISSNRLNLFKRRAFVVPSVARIQNTKKRR